MCFHDDQLGPFDDAGMRGHKTEPYEGDTEYPVYAGPIGEPREIDGLARSTDILPTLIDFCQLKKPEHSQFDGRSLVPRLIGDENALDEPDGCY